MHGDRHCRGGPHLPQDTGRGKSVSMKQGDTYTFAGVYILKPNPDRKWWQVWKPRLVATPDLQTFQVKAVSSSVITLDHKQWQREENARLSALAEGFGG